MRWPTIDAISAMVPLSHGYRYEKLTRSGILALIAGIKHWHNLTPTARALFDVLFPGPPSATPRAVAAGGG